MKKFLISDYDGFCMESGEEFVKTKVANKCTTVAEVIDKIIAGSNE